MKVEDWKTKTISEMYPGLAAEWDTEANGADTPDTVLCSSHDKVYWRCLKKNHQFKASPANRTRMGSECPYCCGRMAITGETDLATLNPDLAAEWNFERNGSLKPEDVTLFSNLPVWWECQKGHVWNSRVRVRSNGSSCPVCSNRRPSRTRLI